MGTVKGRHWSITINNPTDDDYKEIEGLKTQVWFKSWEGQLEHPEGGTLHIQAKLETERVRWGKVKEALTRAHIEVARNSLALANYVHKTDTQVGELPSASSQWMNIQQFYRRMAEFVIKRFSEKLDCDEGDVAQALCGYGTRDLAEKVEALKVAEKDPLKLVEQCAKQCIMEGYMGLEFVTANPQTKAMFKTYFWEVVGRASRNL